jgi:4-hydroxythreonine-4-phosphate dehydrogenase
MSNLPVVAVTLGDAAGIGAEVVAKLFSRAEWRGVARPVVVGDEWVWRRGQEVAGVEVPVRPVESFAEARGGSAAEPCFLAVDSVSASDIGEPAPSAAAGRGALRVLDLCLDGVVRGEVDAICFAPLNKQSMKLGGLKFDDELNYFANVLGVDSYFCEFNTLGSLWTSRVSSHVPMTEIFHYITEERVEAAARLTRETLARAGFVNPRIGIAALNPHGGDGGTCGREEIDILAPALERLHREGIAVEGPYPADTIFLRAQAGHLDAVITLYHDQGQIALKLLGFERGVTVAGGLPASITTPARGTAFDIAGQGVANSESMVQAFLLAARLGAALA